MSRNRPAKPLVGAGFEAVELSHALPPGRAGSVGDDDPYQHRPACWGGWRWPGDEAAGVGGADWIDRERHQYRSSGEPPDPGLVPRPGGSPTEGPL